MRVGARLEPKSRQQCATNVAAGQAQRGVAVRRGFRRCRHCGGTMREVRVEGSSGGWQVDPVVPAQVVPAH